MMSHWQILQQLLRPMHFVSSNNSGVALHGITETRKSFITFITTIRLSAKGIDGVMKPVAFRAFPRVGQGVCQSCHTP